MHITIFLFTAVFFSLAAALPLQHEERHMRHTHVSNTGLKTHKLDVPGLKIAHMDNSQEKEKRDEGEMEGETLFVWGKAAGKGD